MRRREEEQGEVRKVKRGELSDSRKEKVRNASGKVRRSDEEKGGGGKTEFN